MQMRPEIQITSMIKAMSDVILPAVDPNNKLAIEQSQLVIGMLSLMARQLPIQYRFDCDELERLLVSARRMKDVPASERDVETAQERLRGAESAGANVLARCKVDPAELLSSIRELQESLGGIVRSLGETSDTAAQLKAERVILDMSREQLLRDRSMLVMQGFERDPASVPSLESLLDVAA